jgi:hypothetical protein
MDSAVNTNVNDSIGISYDIQIMFNNNDGVSLVDQTIVKMLVISGT